MKRDTIRLIVVIIFITVIVTSAAEVLDAILISSSTGKVKIRTDEPKAVLTVSGPNQQAQYIGQGSVNIRLKPGTYLIGVYDQNLGVMSTVHINKGQTTFKAIDIGSDIKQNNVNNKLISKLPVTGPGGEYYINYHVNYKNGQSYPVITIASTSETTKQAALNWMEYYNFNPADFNIDYQSITPAASSANTYAVNPSI